MSNDFEEVANQLMKNFRAAEALRKWIAKQDHDSCWYYPEIFAELCAIFEIEYEIRKSVRLTRTCFEAGCTKYQDEIYGGAEI